jgi:hypothetical protein
LLNADWSVSKSQSDFEASSFPYGAWWRRGAREVFVEFDELYNFARSTSVAIVKNKGESPCSMLIGQLVRANQISRPVPSLMVRGGEEVPERFL